MDDILSLNNSVDKKSDDLYKVNVSIKSVDKLDNGYIHIVYQENSIEESIITNGIYTLDCRSFVEISNVIKYNDLDYIITRNFFNEHYLICLNDEKRLIKTAESIYYIADGLFKIGYKRVYDAVRQDYIPFTEDTEFKRYKESLFVLEEKGGKQTVKDRDGNTIIPAIEGTIEIISEKRFIVSYDNLTKSAIMDFEKNKAFSDSDLIMQLADSNIMVLNNGKLFILNDITEIVKTYDIGINGRPWCTSISNDQNIAMTFKEDVTKDESEGLNKKEKTLFIDLESDNIFTIDGYIGFNSGDIVRTIDNNRLKGLLNIKTGEVLESNCLNVNSLDDTKNRYFFIEKEEGNFIYDSLEKEEKQVPYQEMEPFNDDGVAIGISDDPLNYQIIDEELNALYNLDHMGNRHVIYQNGILCYHSGNWRMGQDNYTILNADGEILMSNRKCRVKKNSFGILEISDWKTDKTSFFNFDTNEFFSLESELSSFENVSLNLLLSTIFGNDNFKNKLLQDDRYNNAEVKKLILKN